MRISKLSSRGREVNKEFIEKHRSCDLIVFHKESDIPVKAIYHNIAFDMEIKPKLDLLEVWRQLKDKLLIQFLKE